MSDPVSLAIVGAVVTLGGAAIPLGFAMWTLYKKAADAETVARRSTVVSQENKAAIEVVAIRADDAHSELAALRQETGAGRADAARRYEERLAESTGG